MAIRWYSTDVDLKTIDHEIVDCGKALEIADRYLTDLQPRYESGEKALAATMFGFARDDASYMQICIHAPDHIDVEYDFPPILTSFLQRLLRHPSQHSERLTSRDALRSRIELFFALSSESMRQELANLAGR
jgi:hypothetical protein